MHIRKATYDDLAAIKEIFIIAKDKMKKDGNLKQWEKIDYPFCYTKEDIDKGQCFVIENNEKELVATFVYIVGIDPTYNYIEGSWLNNHPYGTIHRIASNGKEPHIFEEVLKYINSFHIDTRIDTHSDNLRMKHLIKKYGFTYCGTIYVRDGTPREAYQKVSR